MFELGEGQTLKVDNEDIGRLKKARKEISQLLKKLSKQKKVGHGSDGEEVPQDEIYTGDEESDYVQITAKEGKFRGKKLHAKKTVDDYINEVRPHVQKLMDEMRPKPKKEMSYLPSNHLTIEAGKLSTRTLTSEFCKPEDMVALKLATGNLLSCKFAMTEQPIIENTIVVRDMSGSMANMSRGGFNRHYIAAALEYLIIEQLKEAGCEHIAISRFADESYSDHKVIHQNIEQKSNFQILKEAFNAFLGGDNFLRGALNAINRHNKTPDSIKYTNVVVITDGGGTIDAIMPGCKKYVYLTCEKHDWNTHQQNYLQQCRSNGSKFVKILNKY